MNRLLALALCLALLAAGAALALLWTGSDGAEATAPPATGRAPGLPSPAGGLAPLRPAADPAAAREGVPLKPGPGGRAGALAAAAPARLSGRTVDLAGRPIEGVLISCDAPQAKAESGADGRFELVLALDPDWPDRRVRVSARKPGFGGALLEPIARLGEAIELGDVALAPAGSISGRVVDPEGRAVAGARVVCTDAGRVQAGSRQWGPFDPLAETASGGDGAFRLEEVPARATRVWAGAQGSLWAFSDALEVPPFGELSGVELVLEPFPAENVIEVLVLAPDGAPLPRARVAYGYESPSRSGSGSGTADEQGRYRHLLAARAPHDFTASDREGRFRPAAARGVQPGAKSLVLQLGEPFFIEVLVRGEDGRPLEDFRLSARSGDSRRRDVARPSGEPPYPGGVARIQLPAEPFLLAVTAEGHAEREIGPFDPERAPPSVEVRLDPLPGVRGRVLAAGKPIPGAKVGLHEVKEPGQSYVVNGFPARSERFPVAEDVSGEDGAFLLTLRHAGRFYLRAEAEGWAPAESGPYDLEPLTGAGGLEIELGRGGAIEGRVIVPSGESPAGAIVGASRGDGFGVTRRAGADGGFRFELLTPGRWLVERRDEEIHSRSTTTSTGSDRDPLEGLPWSCEVREGETTRFDLDLRFEPRAVLAGRILFSGRPRAGWLATLSTEGDSGSRSSAAIDAGGRFRIEVRWTGAATLTVSDGTWSPNTLKLHDQLELAPGDNAWEHDLPLGRIEGRATAEHLYTWAGPGRLWASLSLAPGPDGRFSIEVPAGDGALQPAEGGEQVKVAVPAGGVARVDL